MVWIAMGEKGVMDGESVHRHVAFVDAYGLIAGCKRDNGG